MKTIEEILDMIDFFYTHKRFCERLKRQEQRKEEENMRVQPTGKAPDF